MTWLKLDDGWVTHPKILSVSVEAGWFWLHCATYAAKHETDGFLSRGALGAMYGISRVRAPQEKLTAELLRAGLLDADQVSDGCNVHDFTEWNPTKTEVDIQRDKWRDKKRKQRGTRAGDNDETNEGKTPGTLAGARDAGAHPDPTRPEEIHTPPTTTTSYPPEVVVVLEALVHVETARAIANGTVDHPERYRKAALDVKTAELGPDLALRFSLEPVAVHPLVLAEIALADHPQLNAILMWIDDQEPSWKQPTPDDSAPDSKPSGRTETGPPTPSTNGVSSSSKTASKTRRRLSSVSAEPTESSPPSPSGERPSERSAEAGSTQPPNPNSDGTDLPMTDVHTSQTSNVDSPPAAILSGPAFLGAELGRTGRPRNELDEVTAGWPEDQRAEALAAFRAALPERRRFEGDIWQLDHVRADDGQVFTVRVHTNGFVTGMRADFPAAVWRDAELVDA